MAGLKDVFTYVTGAQYAYKVTTGLNLDQAKQAWEKTYGSTPGAAFGLNAIAGYSVGIVLQETLANAASLDQMALHDAVFGLSGKLTTLAGPFKLDDTGAQIGEITPLGQVEPDGKGMKAIRGLALADASARYVLLAKVTSKSSYQMKPWKKPASFPVMTMRPTGCPSASRSRSSPGPALGSVLSGFDRRRPERS